MFKSIACFATLAAVGALSTSAAAQPAASAAAPQRAVVHYSDLNLASASGRAQLEYRVSAAAAALCGPAPSIRDLGATQAYKACLREAKQTSTPTIAQAVTQQARSQERLAAAGEQ